jgi:SAM-dependent methyltransferase
MIYTALAPLYDRIMSHVDYTAWLRLVKGILSKYSDAADPLVFEAGGGTGTLGAALRREGVRYQGSDLYFAMAREARRKGLGYLVADIRSLPVKAAFDMVIFLYDGINYLPDIDQYGALFREVHRVLNTDGLFLFDITTEYNSLRYFRDYFESDEYGDGSYLRHSHYDPGTRTQYNDFVISRGNAGAPGRIEKLKERHVQKVFPADTVAGRVPPSLFEVLGMWDGFTRRRFTPSSERVHFLLRKKNNP